MSLSSEIERLSRRRHGLYCAGSGPASVGEVESLTRRLYDLFAERREERAQTSPEQRRFTIKRARVEAELEALMAHTTA